MFGATSAHSPTYFCTLLIEQKYDLVIERGVWETIHFISSSWPCVIPQTGLDPATKDTNFLHIIYHYCKQLIVYYVFNAIYPVIKQWPKSYSWFLYFFHSLHLSHHLSGQLKTYSKIYFESFCFSLSLLPLSSLTITSQSYCKHPLMCLQALLNAPLQVHSLHSSHSNHLRISNHVLFSLILQENLNSLPWQTGSASSSSTSLSASLTALCPAPTHIQAFILAIFSS